jgi:hypothetical protein
MLPQVLAGLGLVSVLSAGCLLWLERLQPLFLAVALGSLAYQLWAVRTRPPKSRTWGVKAILTASLVVNFIVIGGWIALQIRYR